MPRIAVSGMSCNHCVMSVTKALTAIPGLANVAVDLKSGQASFDQTAAVDPETIREAIAKIGFVPGQVE